MGTKGQREHLVFVKIGKMQKYDKCCEVGIVRYYGSTSEGLLIHPGESGVQHCETARERRCRYRGIREIYEWEIIYKRHKVIEGHVMFSSGKCE